MRLAQGRSAAAAPPSPSGLTDPLQARGAGIPSASVRTLYYSMRHRTQLYLDEGQYRWLKQRAGEAGSIAAVVRDLIDAERARRLDPADDPLLRFLVSEAPARGKRQTSVESLDRDLYGR
jgi:hypothetical protein